MIGGNIEALLQVKSTSGVNEIGEALISWNTTKTLRGFLDEMGESTNKNNYLTRLEQSTHVFICDYFPLDKDLKKVENKQMIIDDEIYEVLLIDDPMRLHKHIEIYLKYTGGQYGKN